ncbi:hypothetical protein RJ55_05303 [Drechmeria coniospora]|nr:hypothetical protein RJ55_05303 [Drechmeria coniospora]
MPRPNTPSRPPEYEYSVANYRDEYETPTGQRSAAVRLLTSYDDPADGTRAYGDAQTNTPTQTYGYVAPPWPSNPSASHNLSFSSISPLVLSISLFLPNLSSTLQVPPSAPAVARRAVRQARQSTTA